MHGYGFYVYADGMKYDGQFDADEKQGFDIYSWTDRFGKGRKYEGWWHKGKQHGLGTYTGSDGKTVKHGIWDNGKIIKWFDDKTIDLINQGKYDYTKYFKNPSELPQAGKAFTRPQEWDEEMVKIKTLLKVPQD